MISVSVLVVGIVYGITTLNAECPYDRSKPWSYDQNLPNGPQNWKYLRGYGACGGQRQSPINIQTNQVYVDNAILRVTNYDKPFGRVEITNNGYRISMFPRDNVLRTLTFRNTVYKLDSIHFHVGSTVNKGSEHAINGNKFTMECHLEHSSQNGSSLTLSSLLDEGQINYSLYVMLSVRSAYTYQNEYFNGSVSASMSGNPRPERTMIYPDDLADVRGGLYHYAGSLEFPPCTENKYWLVLKSRKQVAYFQLEQFFSLYRAPRGAPNIDQCHLTNNYRPLNPTNGRPVYSSSST